MAHRLTLASYLDRLWSVPADEQIVLVGNPDFYDRFTPCLVRPNPALRFLRSCRKRVGIEDGPYVRVPRRNDSLFLGSRNTSYDSLEILPHIYRLIANRPRYRYRLVIGKGDYSFGEEHWRGAPANLECLLANNILIEDPRVAYLPMGRDFRSVDVFHEALPTRNKEILCYCNYSVDTHPVRRQLYEAIRDKTFITFEHMGEFLHYSLSREEFFRRLAASRFVICPRGNGPDTFRMWDALYAGAIPIVVREAAYHRQLADLPILFLDSYADFSQLTADYLESVYETMLNREYDYSGLLLSTWLRPASTA